MLLRFVLAGSESVIDSDLLVLNVSHLKQTSYSGEFGLMETFDSADALDLRLRASWEMTYGIAMPALRTEVDIALMLMDIIPGASHGLDVAELFNIGKVAFKNGPPGVCPANVSGKDSQFILGIRHPVLFEIGG